MKPIDTVLQEAKAFIDQYYDELAKEGKEQRWADVKAQMEKTGTYVHTHEELSHGAKLAWRNSNRCIGRLFWKTLRVLDCRSIATESAFVSALHEHIRAADKNNIRSVISIFPPQTTDPSQPVFEIKNYTLIMYAGHRVGEAIIGDPAHVDFTDYCKSLGWKGQNTPFDVLPVVYSLNGGPDRFHQLPKELVSEVKITHPSYDWLQSMGLKWYKLPIISSMKLDIGGIAYPASPFNGWYMLDEVATRNFGDKARYNVLPTIAEHLQLDTRSPFWKERALLVLNEAVYHSYKEAGAEIVDHHTAVDQFMKFMGQESAKGREVTGDWTWLIPPTASSTTEIFHHHLSDKMKLPNYLG
ncbi:MAG: nitric oxide synthase oxygenase [Bacteroidota bacterium]